MLDTQPQGSVESMVKWKAQAQDDYSLVLWLTTVTDLTALYAFHAAFPELNFRVQSDASDLSEWYIMS